MQRREMDGGRTRKAEGEEETENEEVVRDAESMYRGNL